MRSVNGIEGQLSHNHFITAVKNASLLEVGQLQSDKLLKQCRSRQQKDNQEKSVFFIYFILKSIYIRNLQKCGSKFLSISLTAAFC